MLKKIILLADLHLASDGKIYGIDPQARLQAAMDDILTHYSDAVAVFILGDLAHRGDADSYRQAAAELSRLPMPFYLLPGNHDRRENLRLVFGDLPPGFMQQVITTPAGDFVLLDSVCEGTDIGEFCAERAQWLRQVLRAARRPVFICMHHPPMRLPLLQKGGAVVEDGRLLAEVLNEFAGRVRHLFFSHMHATIGGVWQNTPFAILRGLAHQTFLSPRQTKDYIFTHAAAHYGVLLTDEQQIVLHHHGFLENTPVSVERGDGKR